MCMKGFDLISVIVFPATQTGAALATETLLCSERSAEFGPLKISEHVTSNIP